jgi:hypothetical protein
MLVVALYSKVDSDSMVGHVMHTSKFAAIKGPEGVGLLDINVVVFCSRTVGGAMFTNSVPECEP